jgi:hypothetical protein
MSKTRVLMAAFSMCCLFPTFTSATSCERLLRKLQGWTILSVTSIRGEFEGCDYGKKIVLEDGSVFTCSEYNYTYSYSPDVIVFAKKITYQGHSWIMVKLVIEDDIFEMESKQAKE